MTTAINYNLYLTGFGFSASTMTARHINDRPMFPGRLIQCQFQSKCLVWLK